MEKPDSNRAITDRLLVRLKSGDARSIHLNALPGPFARIDIYDLIHIDPSLHLRFLHTLLNQAAFRFSLHIDPQALLQKESEARNILQRLVKKLNHLYYQEKEELAEHGYTSFAFGYPLLLKRDNVNPEKIIKAPVFIWYLNIEKDRRSSNTWILSRHDEQPVIFNEALRTHLHTQEHVGTDAIDALLKDEHPDEQQLLEACRILSEMLHIPYDADTAVATLLPGTNKESIEKLTREHPQIRFSGIFGLYKTQKQSIIRDLELLQETAETTGHFEGHLADIEDLCPVTLDPSQEQIIHALNKDRNAVIQGPPGTGKSQSLTGIITTALLNQRKVLVVCEKRTALDVLYQNLEKLGLQELCVLIEDVYADRKAIVNRVRDKLDSPAEPTRFKEHAYEDARSEFLSLQETINHRLNFSRNLFFGDDNWHDIVSKSLQLKEDPHTETQSEELGKCLNRLHGSYDHGEFQSILKCLPEAEALYQTLPEDLSGFGMLQDAALNNLAASELLHQLQSLHGKTLTLLKSLDDNLPNRAYDRLTGIRHWIDLVRTVFSASTRQQTEQQAADLRAYQSLREQLHTGGLLHTTLQPDRPLKYLREIHDGLRKLGNLLEQVTHRPEDLHAYQSWRNFMIGRDTYTQAVLEGLKTIRATDWKRIFTCHYYDSFIRHTAEGNGFDRDAETLYRHLAASDSALRDLLPSRIRHLWSKRQAATLKHRDAATLRYLYNQRKNKQFEKRNTLRQIVHADTELFTTMFPVALVNPVTCASVFPLEPGLFDLVILDEASQLKIEETYSSLYRGKSRVVSGDRHQMPPSTLFGSTVLFQNSDEPGDELDNFLAESHSLLEYANDSGYPNHYLDFHYRSRHPQLIAFSNAAFYQGRLVPMPRRSDYQPFYFYDVQGVYSDGINTDEARSVVDLIYRIDPHNDVFPSVGVATFNIFQRDLILDLLWERAYEHPENLARLEGLLQQGLFVKNLENIQGDERDIMILSTTFGKDEQGKFRQLFGPLTQEKGYQLLNVIITRAKTAVHIFCSIPEAVFINYREELLQKGNTGKAVFYAYLTYAKACAGGNETQAQAVLETLARDNRENTRNRSTSTEQPLSGLIYHTLRKRYGDAVKQHYPFGGYILPIALLQSGKAVMSIETDEPGATYGDAVAYRFKLHRESILESYGIKTWHTWAYDFWKDPSVNLRLICDFYENL